MNQLVPESLLGSRCQLTKVIAHRRVDAQRTIRLAQGQCRSIKPAECLAQRLRVEHRERAAGSPFSLVETAKLVDALQNQDASRRTAAMSASLSEAPCMTSPGVKSAERGGETLRPAFLEKRRFERGGWLLVR